MPVNADKPHIWKADVAASIDFYNDWFMRFGPETYRDTRAETTALVARAKDQNEPDVTCVLRISLRRNATGLS